VYRFRPDKSVGYEATISVHAKCAGSRYGWATQRIVGIPKTRSVSLPAELLPLFLATPRVISLTAAINLVPAKRSALGPELKAFIDRAIVPVLVKAYLADAADDNLLAPDEVPSDNCAVAFVSL
jgi:hypothetical protein